VDVEPDTPLLWVIRDASGLTGTKFGCGMALCGACTVHPNGKPVRSRVTRLGQAAGEEITTIEGLGLAAVLRQEITIEKGRVVQGNFDTYPPLRPTEIPEIKVQFVQATDEPIAGIGEEIVGWVALAVCNAIFAVTGKRIRSLPLKRHDLSWHS
jgi:succinate dehydrogenase/fumarate reductase-like Fe-S protein